MTSVESLDSELEPWLLAYLNEGADLRQAAAIAGISHQEVSNRLERRGYHVRSQRETNALRDQLAIAAHGDAIRSTFLRTRRVETTGAELGLLPRVVRAYLTDHVPDYQVLARSPRVVAKNYTSAELLDSLREASAAISRNLTSEAYREFVKSSPLLSDGRSRPGGQAMHLRFGSWSNALSTAGLPANPPGGPPKRFDDPVAALAMVVACWKDVGGPPSVSAYAEWQKTVPGAPSSSIALRLLGSWNSTLVRAWQVVHGVQLDPDDVDVAVPSGLAQPWPEFVPYSPANENAEFGSEIELEKSKLPELQKALRNHAALQNQVAAALGELGFVPLSPGGSEVKFDLAFLDARGELIVAEVKSCTPANVEAQLRMGLGQVLRYAHQLQRTHGKVRAVLVTQLEPSASWRELFSALGVASIYQDKLVSQLADLADL